MRGREGIVAIDIAKRGQLAGEIFVIGLLTGVEADVFHELQIGLRVACGVQRWQECHVAAQGLFQRGKDLAQAHFLDDLALGPSEMRQQRHLAAARQDVVHRGDDPLDPRGIGDAALFDRHVDVDTQEHALAVQFHIVQ